MTTGTLRSRLVRAALRCSMPERVADEAAVDLLEDHDRVRSTKGSARASLFLVRECLSLVFRSLWESGRRLMRSSILLRRDLSHACRAIVRRPGSSLATSVMLAAGLAAVIGAFGFASALLFRPINEHQPDLRRIGSAARSGRMAASFSETELVVLRRNLEGVGRLAGANLQPVILRAGDADSQTLVEVVSGD